MYSTKEIFKMWNFLMVECLRCYSCFLFRCRCSLTVSIPLEDCGRFSLGIIFFPVNTDTMKWIAAMLNFDVVNNVTMSPQIFKWLVAVIDLGLTAAQLLKYVCSWFLKINSCWKRRCQLSLHSEILSLPPLNIAGGNV